jgi:uncharacterized lipoprotein YmbA
MTLLRKHTIIIFLVPLLSGLLLVSACSTTQKADFYQLGETSNTSLTGIEKGSIIGVGPLQLPEYINRPQIITRTSTHHLNMSEFHRWVEPLNDSITRMLVINLSNNLHSNRIYWIPRQDRQFPLDLRISIDIGRFDGQLGGTVSLEARWSVFDKKDKPILTKVSLIKEPVKDQNYNELVIAMNQALLSLGTEISQAVVSILNSQVYDQ